MWLRAVYQFEAWEEWHNLSHLDYSQFNPFSLPFLVPTNPGTCIDCSLNKTEKLEKNCGFSMRVCERSSENLLGYDGMSELIKDRKGNYHVARKAF